MPTERFYRLSEGKKRIIREAAFHEFARVPVDKVSINQIIKEADISRGSFYTYFEDKWDVLNYIFEESQREVKEYIALCLEQSEGNLWYVMEKLLEKLLEMCAGREKFAFVKNVTNHTSTEELMCYFTEERKNPLCGPMEDELAQKVYERCVRGRLRDMTQQEFHSFIQLVLFSVAVELKGYFEGASRENAIENFRKKIEILKWGVCPTAGDGSR